MKIGDNNDEMWDLYDENRNLTGKLHRRGDKMEPGEYHLVVHICIFNSKNQLLVQRRQPWKEGWPNMWDLSAAGSAVSGDDSRSAAIREVKEELGIDINLDGIRPSFTINFEHGFDDYYFIKKDVDIKELKLQEEEVRDAKWVNEEELKVMVDKGEMIPYFFVDKLFVIKDAYGIRTEKPKKIQIEYLQEKNLDSWMSLVEIENEDIELEQFIRERRLAEEGIRNKEAICALVDKQVVGSLLFSKDKKAIVSFYIHPRFKNKEVGNQLINKLLSDLGEKEIITVNTENQENIEFFKSIGFVVKNKALEFRM